MYRYRLLLTIRGEPVGVAVETPTKDLIIQLGKEVIEFEKENPGLEYLPHYIEKIAEKEQYKGLGLDYCGRIKEIPDDEFISLDHLIKHGKAY